MTRIIAFEGIDGTGKTVQMQRQFERLALMGGRFLDLLKGLPTLKLLGRGAEQAEGVAQAADAYRRGTLSVLRIAFLSSAVLELLAFRQAAEGQVLPRVARGHATQPASLARQDL